MILPGSTIQTLVMTGCRGLDQALLVSDCALCEKDGKMKTINEGNQVCDSSGSGKALDLYTSQVI
jgi:hypothetical protein